MIKLKYGCNPHQAFASLASIHPENSPVEILNGKPSYINFLDALNAWQLVRETRIATGIASAASFKHVSPAGAAVATELPDDLARAYEVEGKDLTPASLAYVRARGADPKCSFGDFAALSEPVDEATAIFLKGVVSDGIIAPHYDASALEILKTKKGGSFVVLRANQDFEAPERESREVFGMTFTQDRNAHQITTKDIEDVVEGNVSDKAKIDLLLGMISLKYTQSNSVGYALDGQMIGIGAGQQSRVDCTKLAGLKADIWHLGKHPKVLNLVFKDHVKRQERINWRIRFIEGDLTNYEKDELSNNLENRLELLTSDEQNKWLSQLDEVSLISDGFIPFRDNIDHASKHGVKYVAQPGGSTRDAEIAKACQEYGMTMVHTNLRLFHH